MNKKRIVTSLVINLLVEGINKLSPFFLLHFAKSRLGLEGFGYAQFAISLVEAAIPFVVYGYVISAAKEISRIKNNPREVGVMVSSLMLLRGIHALATLAVLVCICVSIPQYNAYTNIVLITGLVLFASAIELSNVLMAWQKIHVLNLSLGFAKIIALCAVYFFVLRPEDANLYVIFSFATNALVCVVTVVYGLRFVKLQAPSVAVMKTLLYKGSEFALIYIGFGFLDRFDIFLAEYFSGAAGAGIYAGPARIAMSLHGIIAASGLIFLSEILGINDRDKLSHHVSLSLVTASAFLFPAGIGVWFVDESVLQLIFGADFIGYGRLLSILVIAALLQGITTTLGFQVLAIQGQVLRFSIYLLVGLIVGMGSAFLLQPMYGLSGIAFAVVLAKLVVCLLVTKASSQYLSFFPWKLIGRLFVASLVMASALIVFETNKWGLTLLVGALVYFVSVSVLFRREVLKLFK